MDLGFSQFSKELRVARNNKWVASNRTQEPDTRGLSVLLRAHGERPSDSRAAATTGRISRPNLQVWPVVNRLLSVVTCASVLSPNTKEPFCQLLPARTPASQLVAYAEFAPAAVPSGSSVTSRCPGASTTA